MVVQFEFPRHSLDILILGHGTDSTGLQISNISYKAGDPVYEIAKLLNKTPTTTVYDTCNL